MMTAPGPAVWTRPSPTSRRRRSREVGRGGSIGSFEEGDGKDRSLEVERVVGSEGGVPVLALPSTAYHDVALHEAAAALPCPLAPRRCPPPSLFPFFPFPVRRRTRERQLHTALCPRPPYFPSFSTLPPRRARRFLRCGCVARFGTSAGFSLYPLAHSQRHGMPRPRAPCMVRRTSTVHAKAARAPRPPVRRPGCDAQPKGEAPSSCSSLD